MSYEAILYETRGPVAIITLNRPERLNAIGAAVREEVHAAIEAAHHDDAVRAPSPDHVGERFVQNRVGLHHVCFRVRERDEVDEAHRFLVSIGATIVHPPQDDNYAPGYYSVLFEDPDGIRLEINHVPGQGLLTPGGSGHVGQPLT